MAYIMIVDDDDQLTSAMITVLRRSGHEVVCQPDPSVAIEQMQQHTPELVILDVMFPEDDFAGFELARAMQARRQLSRIPILMLTAVNVHHGMGLDTLDIDNSFLPVSDFLDKPVDLRELVSKVDGMLGMCKA